MRTHPRTRRILFMTTLVSVVAAIGMAIFPTASASAAITGNTIIGPAGKCVDVSGDDTGVNGTAIALWDCQTTSADQHWTWSGTALTTLGRCLDVTSGGTANGALLQLWDCNGTGAQNWVAQSNGTLKNPQSGRCIDSPGGTRPTAPAWRSGTATAPARRRSR